MGMRLRSEFHRLLDRQRLPFGPRRIESSTIQPRSQRGEFAVIFVLIDVQQLRPDVLKYRFRRAQEPNCFPIPVTRSCDGCQRSNTSGDGLFIPERPILRHAFSYESLSFVGMAQMQMNLSHATQTVGESDIVELFSIVNDALAEAFHGQLIVCLQKRNIGLMKENLPVSDLIVHRASEFLAAFIERTCRFILAPSLRCGSHKQLRPHCYSFVVQFQRQFRGFFKQRTGLIGIPMNPSFDDAKREKRPRPADGNGSSLSDPSLSRRCARR